MCIRDRVPPAPEQPGLPVHVGRPEDRHEHALVRLPGGPLPAGLGLRHLGAVPGVQGHRPGDPPEPAQAPRRQRDSPPGRCRALVRARRGAVPLRAGLRPRRPRNPAPGPAAALGRCLHHRIHVRQPTGPERHPDPGQGGQGALLRRPREHLEGHPGRQGRPGDHPADVADPQRQAGGRRRGRGAPRVHPAGGEHPADPQRGGGPAGKLRRPLCRRPGRAGQHHAVFRQAVEGRPAVHPVLLQRHPYPPGHVRHHGLLPQPAGLRIPDANPGGRPQVLRPAAVAQRPPVRGRLRLQRRFRLGQPVRLLQQPGHDHLHRPQRLCRPGVLRSDLGRLRPGHVRPWQRGAGQAGEHRQAVLCAVAEPLQPCPTRCRRTCRWSA